VRAIVRAVVALLFVLVSASPAVAQSDEQTTTIPPGSVAIGDGLSFSGAHITNLTNPTEPPRDLPAYQAAVFIQSFLPGAFFSNPVLQDPPADLPVYRVDVDGVWGVINVGPYAQTIYYASDGSNVWLSYPQNQAPTDASPPPPGNWFVASGLTSDAFNGHGVLQDTEGTREVTSTTAGPSQTSSSGGSSATPIVIIVVVAVVLLGGSLIWRRRRAASPAR
jgi:MYXO-CTERM domain-containing protein